MGTSSDTVVSVHDPRSVEEWTATGPGVSWETVTGGGAGRGGFVERRNGRRVVVFPRFHRSAGSVDVEVPTE